jgi:hypothetical protein
LGIGNQISDAGLAIRFCQIAELSREPAEKHGTPLLSSRRLLRLSRPARTVSIPAVCDRKSRRDGKRLTAKGIALGDR